MSTIYFENWDSDTSPPALPSGWNASNSNFITVAASSVGNTPISSPNVVENQGISGTWATLTWATMDGVSGNVIVPGTVYFGTRFGNAGFSVLVRGSQSTLSFSTSSFYEFQLSGIASTFAINAIVTGTLTNLFSVSVTGLANGVWYQVTPSLTGHNITATVQRLSDNYWLNMSTGSFQSSSTGNTASITDSSITGQGYAGLASITDRFLYHDDWGLETSGVIDFPINASPGVFTLTGVSAALMANAPMSASCGVFGLTGKSADLLHNRQVPANPGEFILTGKSAGIGWGVPMTSSAGVFDLTGESAGLEYGHVTMAGPGSFALDGIADDVMPSDLIDSATGVFLVGRIPAELTTQHLLPSSAGVFTLDGIAANIEQPYVQTSSVGVFTLDGVAAGLGHQSGFASSVGQYVLNGTAADLVFIGQAGTVSYHVYSNTGVGDPIDYETPIDTTAGLTYTTGALAYPGTWTFGVRAFFNGNGIEETNVDAVVTIILGPTGLDITNQPPAPMGLRGFPSAGGAIRVEWTCPPSSKAKQPIGFYVYTGVGTLSYETPTATVLFSTAINNVFVANMTGFANATTYTIGVRSYNATAVEQNQSTISVTAASVGPTAVQGLVGIATS